MKDYEFKTLEEIVRPSELIATLPRAIASLGRRLYFQLFSGCFANTPRNVKWIK